MVDSGVIEGSNDLKDSIDTTDMGEEFISESFTLTCSFDEPCDIDEFDSRWDDLRPIHDHTDLLKTFIVHIHDSDIWFYRTEWEVRCLGSIGFGERIKKCGFANIGETDDSDLHDMYGLGIVDRDS